MWGSRTGQVLASVRLQGGRVSAWMYRPAVRHQAGPVLGAWQLVKTSRVGQEGARMLLDCIGLMRAAHSCRVGTPALGLGSLKSIRRGAG